MPTKLTWNGHSNVRIACEAAAILIDPFFEGNPTAPIPASEAGPADVVCVTHAHGDHLGSALAVCRATGATLVAMPEICEKLVADGLPESQTIGMNIGGTVELKGCRIKMVQAVHSSPFGAPAGFILTLPDGLCCYHAGDTGLFSSMELFSVFHTIHLALLPIDGHYNMDARQAAYACRLLKCGRVVPIHWGTFPILAQGTGEFRAALEELAPDTMFTELRPGESLSLPSPGPAGDCGCE
ncbi:UPF0173 metal-dependent hydrolase [Desulfovibrio sp. X2]|uniref:metal-dependent hydrolase n=1 Tax=Desulfovibrio sp. X2 TaxID=941449 RepID=UPI000358A4B7|nr:metal-dependent hydrolase [Desulfovibrio sp. X2]EPR37413.1 UPF0173 metal-dependent hydrolase [Desulfovibrio sp. X2]